MPEFINKYIAERCKFIAGVDVFFDNENNFKIDLSIIKSANKKLTVENREENLHSIEELSKYLKPDYPVCISFDGKGVFHKKTTRKEKEEIEIQRLLGSVLPGVKADDFFIQYQLINDKDLYVSFCRKNQIEPILKQLNEKKIFVTNLIAGPFSSVSLIQLINCSELITRNCKIVFNDIAITHITEKVAKNEESINILGQIIPNNQIIPFSNTLLFFYKPPNIYNSFDEEISIQKNEFYYQKIFNFLLIALPSFILIILIANLAYFYYNKNLNSQLSVEYKHKAEIIKKIQNLERSIEYKRKFIADNNLSYSTRFSYFADRLALMKPPGINFVSMNIFPLKDDFKSKEELQFTKNFLTVQGNSTSIELDHFISNIRSEDWCDLVNITSYSQLTNQRGLFVLDIAIKDFK